MPVAVVQGNLGPDLLDKSWGALWHANMRQRDFTVNAIMYDPFSHLLFDYMGGVADCTRRRLQCCKDPNESFQEDPHRMLRAVRLAGRCGEHAAHPCCLQHSSYGTTACSVAADTCYTCVCKRLIFLLVRPLGAQGHTLCKPSDGLSIYSSAAGE